MRLMEMLGMASISTAAAAQNAMGNQLGQGVLSQNAYNTITNTMLGEKKTTNKKIFQGTLEVNQVANGYVVHIGKRDGYEYETHIAATITEVNEIIAAQIVAFKLEDKS